MGTQTGRMTFLFVVVLLAVPACFAAVVLDKCPAQFAQSNLNGQPWSGASYSCVFDLQKALNVIINAGLTTDGKLGDITTTAIRKFQGSTPGLTVDGIVGPETTAAINSRFAATQASTPTPTPTPTKTPTPAQTPYPTPAQSPIPYETFVSLSGCQNDAVIALMKKYRPAFRFNNPATTALAIAGSIILENGYKVVDALGGPNGACWGACQFQNCGTGGCSDNPIIGQSACYCRRCDNGAGTFLTDSLGLVPVPKG